MKSGSFPENLGRGEKYFVYALMGVAAVIVFGSLFGLLVQFLWNATLVGLFGVGEISFWQAIGVLILAKLFFGFGNSGSSSRGTKRRKKRSAKHDDDDLMKEQAFRDYWDREGKAAYEAYKSSRDDEEPFDENK